MTFIRDWAVAVCSAAVLCTLLSRLFPDTAIGRQGRLLLPCLFVCALLVPLAGGMPDFSLPDFTATEVETEALEARMQQQMTQQVNNTLLAMANQALQNYGYTAKKVTVDMDIHPDGRIDMGQITLYVDEDTLLHGAEVKQIAEKRLGTQVYLARWEEPP